MFSGEMMMWILTCNKMIEYGPFDTYLEAEREWWNHFCPCGCGKVGCEYPYLDIAQI